MHKLRIWEAFLNADFLKQQCNGISQYVDGQLAACFMFWQYFAHYRYVMIVPYFFYLDHDKWLD